MTKEEARKRVSRLTEVQARIALMCLYEEGRAFEEAIEIAESY